MTIWVDAQLSPSIAVWINSRFGIAASALRDLGLRDATDREIFLAAKNANVIVMTKDSDFLRLLDDLGTPPKVIWLTCGNTSNARLREILEQHLEKALELLQEGEQLVEISAL
jgi:predicted nuclease of predicted toxin-antitoxin system